jgi:peptidyl-tRNA hydrolase, PTH2 family
MVDGWMGGFLSGRRSQRDVLVAVGPHPTKLLRSLGRRGRPHAPTTGSWEERVVGVGPKMVIVLRGDLRMSPGKAASQAAHAALTLYRRVCEGRHSKVCTAWEARGQKKVILRATGEKSLRDIAAAARRKNIPVTLVHDQGRTEVDAGTVTGLALGPGDAADIDRVTGNLRLY